MVRGLLSNRHLTTQSLFPLSSPPSNSCLLLSSGGAGAGTFVRRTSLFSRVHEHVCDGVTGMGLGLRLHNLCGELLGIRAMSSSIRGRLDGSTAGLSKARQGSVMYCDSSSAAETSTSENVQETPKVFRPVVSFCQSCGGAMQQRIPEGEHELRAVCSKCGSIHYQNPKMVVGCLVEHENKVLLCRRNIEPSYGLWTLPAGYMELGESAAEGAARETLEEARADVEVVAHFAHLDIPLIGQSYIIFRARFKQPTFSPGPESLECALFSLDEIPFDSIAFSSVTVALKMYIEDVKAGRIRHHHGVIVKRSVC